MIIQKKHGLKGEVTIPGDKSISHRAIMLGSIAEGRTEITNFLQGADCLSTIQCFRQMGIEIENNDHCVQIIGKGLRGLKKEAGLLDVGNSGTTIRLMSGILAGSGITAEITGDASIQKRPMKRIIDPLSQMGAKIKSNNNTGCAPLQFERIATNESLHGIAYRSPVASAQIKSAVLLAGLYADTATSVTEPYISRNHTELMLESFGAKVETDEATCTATVHPALQLNGQKIKVPGDISSAAYFIAAALLVQGSELLLKNVGINPTRSGILEVCRSMGADITLQNEHNTAGEAVADILIRHSPLKGTTIEGAIIPTLIDEIPIIAVMACFADGTTIIKDAAELKVKESNRIDTMADNLLKMGADITATDDGLIIKGNSDLKGAEIDSKMDHRIAMSFAIAGLLAEGSTKILNAECIEISYPDFFHVLDSL